MYRIGILQLTQNLDDAVRGFKQGLNDAGISAEFHYLNADGNLAELPKLAEELAGLEVDLIFACSTPAAKAAAGLAAPIPVVFTPVFDPVGAGLVRSMSKPGGKATGMAGMVKAAAKVEFIQQLLPAAQKIGILYHTTDANSLLETENFRTAAAGFFELTELPVHTPEELSLLENILPPGLDGLFIPIGRVIEENFASIVYYTDARSLPIIASHAPNVPAGALGALTANHQSLGRACSAQAVQILQGASPAAIPVGIVENPEILLNQFSADSLGIELPAVLLAAAQEVYE
ncbi:ABC transporter substrate-binding protein|uniref:Putative ABC transport system substrate-binding protein n=1 Tax=Dendrosporobacter quercicolus TaxID=146817 RepID=A0A1G9S650_9FIRM|nr:ABC transporter substrate-binding protein [Dendrosporobacter quercicolus]NSL49456.1 ABC transporter substrate-binding protein [Dendrosporobacter quercicolus DSM 1736]SDM30797.1 putative ABC transport system substrate-binding protein [Dendrosporobacter quercicolus]